MQTSAGKRFVGILFLLREDSLASLYGAVGLVPTPSSVLLLLTPAWGRLCKGLPLGSWPPLA